MCVIQYDHLLDQHWDFICQGLWHVASVCKGKNGRVVEVYGGICISEFTVNNGKGTRFNISDSSMSCIDLTIVSGTIALEYKY